MELQGLLRCPACDAENAAAARFCNQCSRPLAPGPATAPAGAERKQVSVLFSDLTGFTAISEKLDPEETRQIMARIFGLAAEIVGRYEGRIEKFIGDAVMAIFGVPQAHEDDPVRAVRAAVALHEAVARLAPELQARTGAAVALHSGVNTGVVVTGDLQFDRGTAGPLGDTINVAARLMNAAPSGEIWVGPETRRLVRHAFDLDDLGAHAFKGKTLPVEVARVRRVHARAQPAGHHRAAFVGRLAELGALLGAAEKVRDAVPQVFGVRGDAGTGKTRLVAEFRARVGTDVRWLEGRAYPYAQDTPYAPLIDLFSRMLGIEETDPPAAVRAALAQCVADLLGEAPKVLPLLLHLFHLEQEGGLVIEREAFRERLEDAIRLMVSALAKRAPTVVCVQDLHWADQSTLALLQRLGTDLSDPLLLLTNYRSGYVPGPGAQELVLGELSPLQTGELLNSLLDGAPPTELARFVTERSDGNPFYIEEIVNSLVETQSLQRGEKGWTLTRPLAEAGLPSTIRGVIAARIDRLDETRRRVLRQAAVVGREFLYSIVARVADDTADLGGSLSELQSADLIRAQRPDPDLEYIFKHALTQDVAYEGLLKTERQVLHARTAQAMEAVLAERVPEFVETLAFHWLRAGVADKAVHYLAEAGRKCVERFALPEATSHFRHAYALLADVNRTPEQSGEVAELLCAWSQVHYYEGTIGEWRTLLEMHLDDAKRCKDDAVLAMYLSWLGNARYFNGDCRGAHLAFDQALATGTPIQARRALAYTEAGRVFALFDAGRIDEAVRVVEAFDQTKDERLSDPYPVLKQKGGLTMALSIAGMFAQARDVGEQLIEFGTRGGHPCAVAMGHSGLSWNALLSLDFDRAIAMSSAGMAAARDDLLRVSNADVLAVALAARMRFDELQQVCDAWLPYLERNDNRVHGLHMRQVKACVDLVRGDLSDGFRCLLLGPALARAQGVPASAALLEMCLLMTLVSVARLDIKPSARALLLNPWFVFTQAPFAAHRARALIAKCRTESEGLNFRGVLGLIDLCEARLLAHKGRRAEAREVLNYLRERLLRAGVDASPAPVRELAAEIESC